MMKKRLSLFLAALMLALPLTACSGKTGESGGSPESEEGETVEKPALLTHVFRGNGVTLPDDYSILYGVAPSYDEETGELTLTCNSYEEITDDEGNYIDYIMHNYLLTYGADGTLLSQNELSMGDGAGSMQYACTVGDTMVYLTEDYEMNTDTSSYCLHRKNLTTGETVDSDDLVPLFSENQTRPWFYINQMCVDSEGWVYLSSEEEVLVTDERFIKQFSIYVDRWINSMAASPDGKVYVTSFTDDGMGIIPIDKEKKALGEPHILNDSPNELFFGRDHDLYYTTENGVSALDFAKEGESEDTVTPILDYINSDLAEDSTEIYAVIDSETIVMGVRDPETYQTAPGVYKKAEDIDLSKIKVIEVASEGTGYDAALPAKVVAFNKAHTDVRVIVTDYSVYSTPENYEAGSEKLARDIVNGLYKPDLVVGMLQGTVFTALLENGLYRDLKPLLDTDPDYSYDDLFGSLKRTFSDAEGKLWGLTPSIRVNTLVARADQVGSRQDWTLTELLDFADTLPEGVQLCENLSQQNAAWTLLGSGGYGAFLDLEANACSFDSPDFVRYLNFLAGLPQKIDYGSMDQDYYDNLYREYHEGRIILKSETIFDVIDWLRMRADLGTEEVAMVGYPHREGETGSPISSSAGYLLTSFCEFPEEAWSFLRTVFKQDQHFGRDEFPVFKTELREAMAEYYDYEFAADFTGGMSWGPADPEHPMTEDDLTEPGMIFHFTEADTEAIVDFLDNRTGVPMSQTVPQEIQELVDEEVSSFLGGARSAEECAKLIQSRVSLWLAEHE